MIAFYVVCNGYEAILIPETNQAWISPSSKDLELFASSPDFVNWQGSYESSLEEVHPNIVSVRQYWEAGSETAAYGDKSVVVAQSDDATGMLTVFDKERWNRKVEGLNLPKSA